MQTFSDILRGPVSTWHRRFFSEVIAKDIQLNTCDTIKTSIRDTWSRSFESIFIFENVLDYTFALQSFTALALYVTRDRWIESRCSLVEKGGKSFFNRESENLKDYRE
jgi:hypothetical protein